MRSPEVTASAIEAELLDRYRAVEAASDGWRAFEGEGGAPPWAASYPASVPFVGRNYATSSPRILVYGSAENLNNIEDDFTWFRDPERQRNRHRAARDARRPDTKMQGWIGVQPFDEGGLCMAAGLIARWDGAEVPARDGFVERLAVGNVSKFARPEVPNIDVSGAQVRASLGHVLADVAVLRPRWLLLARPVDGMVAFPLARALRSFGGEVVPMWQFQQRAVGQCSRDLRGWDAPGERERVVGDVRAIAERWSLDETWGRGFADWFLLLRRRYLEARSALAPDLARTE